MADNERRIKLTLDASDYIEGMKAATTATRKFRRSNRAFNSLFIFTIATCGAVVGAASVALTLH